MMIAVVSAACWLGTDGVGWLRCCCWQVAEFAVQYFITDNRPNVAGLVMAGSADFKTELQTSGLFDPRLQRVVLQTVDVSYGGEQGFNQAIELAAATLGEVKLVQEKKLLQVGARQPTPTGPQTATQAVMGGTD